VLLVIGPDGLSVRAFRRRLLSQNQPPEFFKPVSEPNPSNSAQPATAVVSIKDWKLLDSATNSEWNFQGCAVSGPARGACLEPISFLKDYWFDWHNYHPGSSIYNH